MLRDSTTIFHTTITFGIFLGESTSDGFGKLTVDYFRLDYDGQNSNNNGGGPDSDKASGKY